MTYSEENLLRLLRYKNIEMSSLLLKISLTLNIQYFEDNGVFTLGSKHFVLDINKKIKIFYVDESLNKNFQYVEFYLTHFFENREYLDFYNHLKYFINFLECQSVNKLDESQPSKKYYQIEDSTKSQIKDSANLCPCVSTFNYCDIYNTELTKGIFIFNIFTHRYEYHSQEEIFVSVPEYLHEAQEINLAMCYQPKFMNRKILEYFKDSFYSFKIEQDTVLVNKECKVFVNDEYDKKKSFMFKKGLNLLDCLNIMDE